MEETRQKCIIVWGVVGGPWKDHGAVVLRVKDNEEAIKEARELIANDNEYLSCFLSDVDMPSGETEGPNLLLAFACGGKKTFKIIGFPLEETLLPIIKEMGYTTVRSDLSVPDWGDKTHLIKGNETDALEFPSILEEHLLSENYSQADHTVFHLIGDDKMCVVTTYMIKEIR